MTAGVLAQGGAAGCCHDKACGSLGLRGAMHAAAHAGHLSDRDGDGLPAALPSSGVYGTTALGPAVGMRAVMGGNRQAQGGRFQSVLYSRTVLVCSQNRCCRHR